VTTQEALSFLRDHQPMPDDQALTEELVRGYRAACEQLLAHPDPACITLVLNSFGKGNGLGAYELAQDVLGQFSPSDTVPRLIAALGTCSDAARSWIAQICQRFPHRDLVEPLARVLVDHDEDCRAFAALALKRVPDVRVVGLLERALRTERAPWIREVYEHCLSELSGDDAAS
jgi:hypothetical protein